MSILATPGPGDAKNIRKILLGRVFWIDVNT